MNKYTVVSFCWFFGGLIGITIAAGLRNDLVDGAFYGSLGGLAIGLISALL